jgi:hypothetical protein
MTLAEITNPDGKAHDSATQREAIGFRRALMEA